MQLKQFNWLSAVGGVLSAVAIALLAQAASANSEYSAAWGPDIGSTAPLLSAVDQDDERQNLQSLTGAKGLLFVFNRSVDW